MPVIHISDAPPGWKSDKDFVYIGRSRKGLEGIWGNPFILYDEFNRAAVLKQYINWLTLKIRNADIKDQYAPSSVAKLADKTLVCFCAPKACHGDVLQSIASILADYEV
jgi:hypothetical protein